MASLPPPITRLVEILAKLPGLGPKSAERIAFVLLKRPEAELESFAKSIISLKKGIVTCNICQNIASKNPCDICSDRQRDETLLCVVARPVDVVAIEKTGAYQGLYHVLGGVLAPLEGITTEQLKVKELLARASAKDSKVKEIIIATNPDMDGETTALYLARTLKPLKRKVTRLARGLPMGSDLEYADEITLESALSGRREMS